MKRRKITCPHYRKLGKSRTCVDYVPRGTCAREDRFLCTEWEKVNNAMGFDFSGSGSATGGTVTPADVEAVMPGTVEMRRGVKKPVKNRYLSYSRIDLYQTCPRAYRYRYVDRVGQLDAIPLVFGTLVHSVCERMMDHASGEANKCGKPVSLGKHGPFLDNEWKKQSILDDQHYSEACTMLRSWIAREGSVEPGQVLGIEKKFQFRASGIPLLGYIDRVDQLDDETIEIIDYKTNRVLFTREEADSSLQLSIYALACSRLYPGKRMVLSYDILRHGVKIRTERTPQQLADVAQYLAVVYDAIERDTSYEARVGHACAWCDHRAICDAYQAEVAATGSYGDAPEDASELAAERERVAAVAKAAYARQRVLDTRIKRLLEVGERVSGAGKEYTLHTTSRYEYPLTEAARALSAHAGRDVTADIAVADPKKVRECVKKITSSKADADLLQAELDSEARVMKSSRLWARKVK